MLYVPAVAKVCGALVATLLLTVIGEPMAVPLE
jgi:hypothetical protein